MWKHDNECKHINSNLANSNAKQHLGSASFVLVLTGKSQDFKAKEAP